MRRAGAIGSSATRQPSAFGGNAQAGESEAGGGDACDVAVLGVVARPVGAGPVPDLPGRPGPPAPRSSVNERFDRSSRNASSAASQREGAIVTRRGGTDGARQQQRRTATHRSAARRTVAPDRSPADLEGSARPLHRTWPDTHIELPRLDNPPHGAIEHAELLRAQDELHAFGAAGAMVSRLKPFSSGNRARDRGHPSWM